MFKLTNAIIVHPKTLNTIFVYKDKISLCLNYSGAIQSLFVDADSLALSYDVYISLMPRCSGTEIQKLSMSGIPFFASEDDLNAIMNFGRQFVNADNVYVFNGLASVVQIIKQANCTVILPEGEVVIKDGLPYSYSEDKESEQALSLEESIHFFKLKSHRSELYNVSDSDICAIAPLIGFNTQHKVTLQELECMLNVTEVEQEDTSTEQVEEPIVEKQEDGLKSIDVSIPKTPTQFNFQKVITGAVVVLSMIGAAAIGIMTGYTEKWTNTSVAPIDTSVLDVYNTYIETYDNALTSMSDFIEVIDVVSKECNIIRCSYSNKYMSFTVTGENLDTLNSRLSHDNFTFTVSSNTDGTCRVDVGIFG